MADNRAEWELYAEKHYLRNFWFGIASAVVRGLPMAFLNADLVMPMFFQKLTPLKWPVGVWSTLGRVCLYVPQFFFAKRVQEVERRKKFYFYGCAMVVVAFLVEIIFIVLFAQSNPTLVLVMYYLMTILGGTGNALFMLAFLDITGRMIPETKRGGYIGLCAVFGSVISIFAAARVVQLIMSNEASFPFPRNYLILHGLSLLTMFFGMIMFIPVREPVVPIVKREVIKLGEHFRRGFRYMKDDPKFRWFTINFAAMQIMWAANAYGIRFVTEDLNLNQSIIGSTLYTTLVAGIVGNFFFGYMGNRFGYRHVIRWCVVQWGPGYALLIFIPTLVRWLSGMNDGWSVEELTKVFYHINVALWSSGTAAFTIGQQNYQITIPPTPHERPVYLSFPLLMFLPIIWVPIFWGWVVDVTGSYRFMFSLVMIFVVVSAVTSTIMPNDRVAVTGHK